MNIIAVNILKYNISSFFHDFHLMFKIKNLLFKHNTIKDPITLFICKDGVKQVSYRSSAFKVVTIL